MHSIWRSMNASATELLVVFLSMFSPLMVELGWDPELDADCK